MYSSLQSIVRAVHELRRITLGMAVSDIANRPIGRVTTVFPDSFSVMCHDGTLMRLNSESLFTVSTSHVWLVCGSDQLGTYQMP
jgi:hypothetical protein